MLIYRLKASYKQRLAEESRLRAGVDFYLNSRDGIANATQALFKKVHEEMSALQKKVALCQCVKIIDC